MSLKIIRLCGCKEHNLQNISLNIPKGEMTVITGVCGSGKSSLAFDTIFAESQRRYLESLSSEVRQWLKQLPKPQVDIIEGLSPAIAVAQYRSALNRRQTVATHTDIYDLLSILYANIGHQYSPYSRERLYCYTPQEIVETLLAEYKEGSRLQIIATIPLEEETLSELISRLQKMGFIRLRVNGEGILPEDPLPHHVEDDEIDVIIDRIVIADGIRERLVDSINTALHLGKSIVTIQEGRQGQQRTFSENYYCPKSKQSFFALVTQDFNFNSPRGMCTACRGEGYLNSQLCPLCQGKRLKQQTLHCYIEGQNIYELCKKNAYQLLSVIKGWQFNKSEQPIADKIIPEILPRLNFLIEAGVGYLELNRRGDTLSVGEALRVQLASQIGAKLSGILYIMDEPSRGLHPQDTNLLITVIKALQKLDNTIIIVEHHRSFIQAADHIVELGPGAGIHGGQIVFQGNFSNLSQTYTTPTGAWIGYHHRLPSPPRRHSQGPRLEVNNLTYHNFDNFSVTIPLQNLIGICGVSGSGKSSLISDIIATQIRQWLNAKVAPYHLQGHQNLKRLIMVDQRRAGVSKRALPASYLGILKDLRVLLSETKLAKARGYTPATFSPNKKGGRCEACQGLGYQQVNLQFMADVMVPCEICDGQRYSFETLQVYWKGKNIADLLAMNAQEAMPFFENIPTIEKKLNLMLQMGLEYLPLGQPFPTLSGGEIQRLKLIAELTKNSLETTLYIFDEPTAGLHFKDIDKLVKIMHRLVDQGHSIIMIEHNIEILHQADWVIELGPGGGPQGGQLIFEGTPERLADARTPTGNAYNP
ncbi:MAG: ABC-ATPase UvrA [Chlamydiota bacterium]